MMNRSTIAIALWLLGAGATGAVVAESQEKPDSSYSLFPVQQKGAIHVLVDDLTGDGLADPAFTSHGGNFVEIYRQVSPRRFEVVPEQTIAGFHPNDMIALPGAPKRYLINAEGDGLLKVVAARPDGQLELVAEHSQPGPRTSTVFSWPGWGTSVAVVPYSGNVLTLLRDFDAEKAEAKSMLSLPLGAGGLGQVRLADLKGDGSPALLLTAFQSNTLWVVEYPGPDKEPVPRQLWSFQTGWPRHVIPFDIDRNGTLDLLVPMSIRPEIAVLINDGKGNFSEGKAIPYPIKPGIHAMTTGQDKDGTRYLLAGGIKALVLYREIKDAPGSFESITLPLNGWPNGVELRDVDGDGWLDAVVASQGAAPSFAIYGPLWDAFPKFTETKS